ncbi:hypothetical protein GCWU000341_02057 [Oribacterium sp. oral taxon 078 str. F0262]|nr:hypothetical protein GCWU000341_02057 [Oribacterium sp. oral taxon 078 str. F0262]
MGICRSLKDIFCRAGWMGAFGRRMALGSAGEGTMRSEGRG